MHAVNPFLPKAFNAADNQERDITQRTINRVSVQILYTSIFYDECWN